MFSLSVVTQVLIVAGHFLYFSNKTEILCASLAELLARPTAALLQKELVLLHSAGMKRYLSLSIARCNGISGGVNFWFLARFLKELLALDIQAPFPFDADRMAWSIWKLLLQEKNVAMLPAPLKSGWDAKSLEGYYFANLLANLFDRYWIHSPASIRDWQTSKSMGAPKSEEKEWQVHLWRALIKKFPEWDLNKRIHSFFETENKPMPSASRLPPRIFVFGISSLPILFREILLRLAEEIEVHWFFLRPGPEATDFTRQTQNSLLQYYDTAGVEFLRSFSGLKRKPNIHTKLLFEKPQVRSLLNLQQQSLYTDASSAELEKKYRKNNKARIQADGSLEIHSCHSPLREVEILQDFLLHQFQKDPQLRPEDVLVMSPDPAAYAPLVEAVFGNPESKESYLPYSLTDTFLPQELSFNQIFFQLMGLSHSRFKATEIFEILSNQWVCQQAGFTQKDLELIGEWMEAAGIRWGLNAEHRRQWKLPAQEDHSFLQGFDRLFLSYALSPDKPAVVADIMPVPGLDIEGDALEVLGRFAEFLECLKIYAQKLCGRYTLEEWASLLQDMETDLLGSAKMHFLLTELIRIQTENGFDLPIDIAPVQAYLKGLQGQAHIDRNFPGLGINFSALLPMRSVPYRVICLLGMNEGSFPRRERVYEFDLLEEEGHPYLRSQEDRLLFLEVLLSARSCLYISYLGQSAHRPSEKFPPSIVVQELCDHLNRTLSEDNSFSQKIIHNHRLQGFHPRYFDPASKANFFSYSLQNGKAAQALQQRPASPVPFWKTFETRSVPEKEEKSSLIELSAFLRFFENTSRAWIREKLDFALLRSAKYEAIAAEEPLELDALQSYKLCNHFIQKAIADPDFYNDENKAPKNIFLEVRALGLLPHGNFGQLVLDTHWAAAKEFLSRVQACGGRKLAELRKPFELELRPDLFLRGHLEAWSNSKGDLICFHYGKCHGGRLLRVWIFHLIWQLLTPKESVQTYLITKDKCRKYKFEHSIKEQARELSLDHLRELAAIYERGLEEPLPFFCKTGHAYTGHEQEPQKAFSKAKAEWENNYFREGEGSEPYTSLCFRYRDPIALDSSLYQDFQALSSAIFKPLLLHSQDIEQ